MVLQTFRALGMLTVCMFLSACDFLGGNNRYELSKDAAGNTVRLDKRTGEIAVIKDGQIRQLKDAAQAEAERKAQFAQLEQLKSWPTADLSSIDVQAALATSWRGDKMYYSFSLSSLPEAKEIQAWFALPQDKRESLPKYDADKRAQELNRAIQRGPFSVELSDANDFVIQQFSVGTLTRLVDDKGLPNALEAKASIAMSAEDYNRIKRWNVRWH